MKGMIETLTGLKVWMKGAWGETEEKGMDTVESLWAAKM